ncbi:hypothetical protein JCM1393_02130 [Clostridium carnis]
MRKKVSKKGLMIKRRERLKQRRKRFFIASSIIISLILLSSFTIYTLIIRGKLKNLSYAVDYHFTSSSLKENRLLRVQEFNLEFSDNETAIIEAYGLTYKKPRENAKVKAYLKRDKNGVWKLDATTSLNEIADKK